MRWVAVQSSQARTTLPQMVRRSAEEYPKATAVIDGDFQATYAELVDHVEDWARALLSLGVRAGDRVGILAPNCWQWIVAALATADIGAVIVPLNTRAKQAELAAAIGRTSVTVLFVTRRFLRLDFVEILGPMVMHPRADRGSKEATVPYVVALDEPSSRSGSMGLTAFLEHGRRLSSVERSRLAPEVYPEDLLEILWTSGSTGAPKGVMLDHGQVIDSYQSWAQVVGLRAGDTYPIVSPMAHGFGLNSGMVASILAGATMLPTAQFDAETALRTVEKQRVTVMVGPPALFVRLVDLQARLSLDVSSLRLGICGAATVPAELVRKMRDVLGFERVVNAYGLIEGSFVSSTRAEDSLDVVASTAGRAAPDMSIRIVDADGSDVSAGVTGEILVRGPGVMRGYWKDPELTAQVLDNAGWLHTRDIGMLDVEGNLSLSGRMTDAFVVGGFNVFPAEVEDQLLRCPGVAAVAVVPMPDRVLGEVPVAFVEAQPGYDLTAEKVVSWARKRLSNYKVPRRVLLQELPVAATGKIDRRRLQDQANGLLESL